MKKHTLGISLGIVALFAACGLGGYMVGKNQTSSTVSKKTEHYDIGILQYISHPSLDQIKQGIIDELAKEGFKDGDNTTIHFLNGQGDQAKLATMSQALVDEGNQLIIPIATPAAKAVANATKEIPIVAAGISDPIGSGLVSSLEHPEQNITGVKNEAPVKDQVAFLQTLLPEAKTIGILYSANEENSKSYVNAIEKEAQKNQLVTKAYAIASSNEIATTIQGMAPVDVLYIPQDNGLASAFQTVVSEADKKDLPIFVSVDNMVKEGGLATVGQNQYDLGVKTAQLAVKTLKEEKTLPFTVVSTGEKIINDTQATRFGIALNTLDDVKHVKGEK